MPALPPGLEQFSSLYNIDLGAGAPRAATLTVRLSKQTEDPRQLGFYTFTDNQWKLLGPVQPADDGKSARGEV